MNLFGKTGRENMPEQDYNTFFSRQIRLNSMGTEAMKKLDEARVLVVGAGGLGCPALMNLAGCGVGTIGIIDGDIIEEHNLHRQQLYSYEDLGKKKAEVAAQKISSLNPFVKTDVYPEKLNVSSAPEIIKSYDVVMDCTDNFSTRYLINDACVLTDKPWVFASVEDWEGQISVFNIYKTDGAKSPSYRCVFPSPPDATDSATCDDAGVLNTFTSILGSIQSNEVVKIILGMESALAGHLGIYDFSSGRFQLIGVERNEEDIKKITTLNGKEYVASEPLSIDFPDNISDYTVIDIREEYEYEENPSGFSNIPFDKAKTYNYDARKKYLFICQSGMKSSSISSYLRTEKDIPYAFSLLGGLRQHKFQN